MFDFFLRIRLKAIKNTATILNSNPFSGPYSLNQIEAAKKNREMNRKWFIKNFYRIKRKLPKEDFQQLGKDLGYRLNNLIEFEQILEDK